MFFLLPLMIGIGGTFFILAAFVLNEFYNKFNQNMIKYNLLNIIGSAGLIYYAVFLSAWPFLILNSIWFVVAVLKLMVILGGREILFSEKEVKLRKMNKN